MIDELLNLNLLEEPLEADDMTISELKISADSANGIIDLLSKGAKIERWQISSIVKASEELSTVYNNIKVSMTEDTNNFLLLSVKNEEEGEEEKDELKIGDYEPSYFHICPTAIKLYKNLPALGISQKLLQQSAQLQDLLYYIEYLSVSTGVATDTDLSIAENTVNAIMLLASKMDLVNQHSYINKHLDIIKSIANGTYSSNPEQEIEEESEED